ncbi:MAG: hypothetical protein RIF41_06960 [Polyangiaceae bacterium]
MFKISKDVAAEETGRSVLPQAERRSRKRWGATALHIDGKFVGMLRFPELPPQLETQVEKLDIEDEDIYVRRFVWADLFAAHGVDIEKIRAVHYYGGRNFIQVVQGDEFRRVGDTFRFNFTSGTRGKPRQRPPADGMDYNTGIDIVRAVAVYVGKEPPTYDHGKITFPDGTVCSSFDEKGRIVIPYSDGERHGGTRVYMDGKYIDAFRRRSLGPELQVDPGSPESPYRLGKALTTMNAAVGCARRIELWDSHDKLAGVIDGERARRLDDVTFVLGQHSRGRVQLPEISDERLSAVIIYCDTEPADRSLPEAGGSLGDQDSSKKANDSVNPVAAQKVQ